MTGRTKFPPFCAGAAILLLIALASTPSSADDRVWATGRIVDGAGKPLQGAMVAAYDDDGRIVDYARTDAAGEYALAVPPSALHLSATHGPGFFAEVVGKVARFVTNASGKVLDTAQSAVRAITVAQASILPSAAAKPALDVSTSLEDRTFQTIKGERGQAHRQKLQEKVKRAPGDLLVKAVAPNCTDFTDITEIYWAQRERNSGTGKPVLAAWLDTIQLAPDGKKSQVQPSDIKFAGLKIEPSLAAIGQEITLSATLPTPSDPPIQVVVVARDAKTGKVWQLQPKGKGVYEAAVTVDSSFAPNDQAICVIAYSASGASLERRQEVEKAIVGAGLWDPSRPYAFNPLLVVSRNRATATLSVAPASTRSERRSPGVP